MKTKIYRIEVIEDNKSIGPFLGNVLSSNEEVKRVSRKFLAHCRFDLPSPEEEGMVTFVPQNNLCGCSSLKQIMLWFDFNIHLLKEVLTMYKLNVYLIDVEKVIMGEYQVLFNPCDAKLLKTIQFDKMRKILRKII